MYVCMYVSADSAAGPDYDYGAENHSALSAPSSEYVR